MSMKPLEDTFFKACVHEELRVKSSSDRELSVRNIVNIFSRLGFPHKQLWGYLDKWDMLGFYEYGVTLDLGWFDFDKLTPRYSELYQEVINAAGVTKWEDGEFANYVNKKAIKRAINAEFGVGELSATPILDSDAKTALDNYRKLTIAATGVPARLLGVREHSYIWVDIVKVGDIVAPAIHSISGLKDDDMHYQIDDFIEAVAKEYNVDTDQIKTYMMDNIDFDPSSVSIDVAQCGCYIDGVPEWLVEKYSKRGGE